MRRRGGGLYRALLLLSLVFLLPHTASGVDIQQINRHILTVTPLMVDPTNLPPTMDREVAMIFLSVEPLPPQEPRYFSDGTAVPRSFYTAVKENMALEDLPPTVTVTLALVVRPTLLRGLPTEKALFRSPQQAKEGDIDLNLYSSIPPGTPVAVIHTTRDRRWAFVLSTYNPGWIPLRDLVTLSREDLKTYTEHRPLAVITVPHCPVFTSPFGGELPTYTLPMGTWIPMVGVIRGYYKVLLPVPKDSPHPWKTFYIPRGLAVVGFLPFQKENILNQATSLLGEPYSWGGKDGVDCSLLVREVFATMGILLPRNSAQQAQVGSLLWKPNPRETLYEALIEAPPGRTLIFLQGHVMIYMGRERGEFRVLHSLYSWQGEKVGRVVTTSLEPYRYRVVRVITIP